MEGRVRRTGVKVTPTTVFRASLGHRRPSTKTTKTNQAAKLNIQAAVSLIT